MSPRRGVGQVSGEDFGPFLCSERYRRHGDRASSDLDAVFRCVNNVAVPGGGGSPSGGDYEASVGGIVFDDFQDDLALLAGDSPDVIEQQDALTEQPAQGVRACRAAFRSNVAGGGRPRTRRAARRS